MTLPCVTVWSCDPAAALAGDAAKSAAQASLDALTKWVINGSVALLGRIGNEITKTTAVQLDGAWFTEHVRVIQSVAILVVLPLLLAALISAVVHQDAGRLIRAVGVHLPLAVLTGGAAMQLTQWAINVTDELCQFVSGGLGNDIHGAVSNVVLAMRALTVATAGQVDGGFISLIIALLVILGAVFVWLELLLRSAAIYVAVMFLPLTLSGLVWPATARWAKRLVEILAALIVSKFVVVAVISLATSALGSNPKDGLASGLAGAALLLLAAFAPFALLRMAPVVEAGVIGHLEGMSRRPVSAGMTSGQTVHRMVQGAGRAGGASTGAGTADGDGVTSAGASTTVAATATIPAPPATGERGFLDGLEASTDKAGEGPRIPDLNPDGSDDAASQPAAGGSRRADPVAAGLGRDSEV